MVAAPSIVPPFPCHPLTYEGDVWTCPNTGVVIQKALAANLEQRKRIVNRIEEDSKAREDVIWACKHSFLVWLNLFGWTYRQHEVLADGTRRPVAVSEMPFISWPVQDTAANTLIRCIRTGVDCLWDKSRDMGASWLNLAVITWISLHEPNSLSKVVSRKEEEVDSGGYTLNTKGNPDTLLWKIRYMIARLPACIRPEVDSAHLRVSLPNGSVINGESTNNNVGRGGRRKVMLLDECSVYDDLASIDRASHSAASCRIFNATPVGPGAYSDIRFSGKTKVVVLGWWDHPEKAKAGRYVKLENGKPVWSGPFREGEISRGVSMRAIAQNLDIDHERSGNAFFDLPVLKQQAQLYAGVEPVSVGMLVSDLRGDDLDEAIRSCHSSRERPWRFDATASGPLRLWCKLVQHPFSGEWVPPMNTKYVMGIDIAQGVGASNSSIAIFARETGEQVAEWTSSEVSPERLARVASMLGWWFHGVSDAAFMAWEANGWGQTFGPIVAETLNYPWVYKHTRHDKGKIERTQIMGWWNSPNTNRDVLGRLRDALSAGKIIIRSPEALREAERYIINDVGDVEMAGLEEEGARARAAHGDRWRAISVAWEAFEQAETIPSKAYVPPQGTVEAQLAADEEEKQDGLPDEQFTY